MNIKILKLILVIFVSSVVIIFSSSEIISEEFAMGEETKSYYAKDSNNEKIHFSSLKVL